MIQYSFIILNCNTKLALARFLKFEVEQPARKINTEIEAYGRKGLSTWGA
jgi:hypothetical protein